MTRSTLSKEFQAGRMSLPQFIAGLQNDNATTFAVERHRAKVAARLATKARIDAALLAIMPVSGAIFLALVAFFTLTH